MSVRPPAVAGLFYPASPGELASEVSTFIEHARDAVGEVGRPKAVIVPHAGYVYSGSMAALGYALAARWSSEITKVVLLGPCHRVAVDGLALPAADAFATPLGVVELDVETMTAAREQPQVLVSAAAHEAEHSLEVQLPFLQSNLGQFELTPFAVGRARPQEVADVIDACWGGEETLIVISSDLSHYLPYAQAQREDAATIEQILALDGPLDHDQACGATPINGMLVAAERHGLTPTLLGACNSGDTAGDRARVVGYTAIAFEEQP